MQTVFDHATLDAVSAPLEFAVHTDETPVTQVRQPGNGPDRRTGSFVQREVSIHDALFTTISS